jgi:UDP-glucose 4-epimerase
VLVVDSLIPDYGGNLFNIDGIADREHVNVADIRQRIGVSGSGSVSYVDWPSEKKAIDIGSFHADSTKFARATGWRPAVALEQGLRRTIAFYRANMCHYVPDGPGAENV